VISFSGAFWTRSKGKIGAVVYFVETIFLQNKIEASGMATSIISFIGAAFVFPILIV